MDVLIIDDNNSLRGLNSRILEQLGCQVTQAGSSQCALELLHDTNPFDVIFVDFRLPYMNGLQVLKHIKTCFPDACVFMISAAPDSQLEVTARQNGASGCILGYVGRDRFQKALEIAQRGQSCGIGPAG